MDIGRLRHNAAHALAVCPRRADWLKMMAWTYAHAVPGLKGRERDWEIQFRFAPPSGDLTFKVRTNNGSDRFIFSEVFEHGNYDLPLDPAPRTILDLGANCGFAAAYFARRYPGAAIASVEPMAGNCRVLRQNIAINGLGVRVFEAAIDAEDGTATMLRTASDYGSQVLAGDPAPGEEVQACRTLSVRSVMEEMQWTRIGLAKIDIEGHERVLLSRNTDWLADTDAVIIECHPGYGEAELRELAGRYGFLAPQVRGGLRLLVRQHRSA